MNLDWDKTISCDNQEESKWASNCIIRLNRDAAFKKKVTCENGNFVMKSIALDPGTLRRCEAYQYLKVSLPGLNTILKKEYMV